MSKPNMREPRPRKPAAYCANCGARVSVSGRPPLSGKRFCGAQACRAAKARTDYHHRQKFVPKGEVPMKCSSCGGELAKRPYRAGDEMGRWCKKKACRAHRDEVRRESGTAQIPELLEKLAKLEVVVQVLEHAVMADAEDNILNNRIICHECGLTTALKYWVHPTRDMQPCEGTLQGTEIRAYGRRGLLGVWPFPRKYLSPNELKEAYGDA